MIVIYIIGGLVLIVLAIKLIDRWERMNTEIKTIRSYQNDIRTMNEQLDELEAQLDELHGPIVKMHDVSQKILKYMK